MKIICANLRLPILFESSQRFLSSIDQKIIAIALVAVGFLALAYFMLCRSQSKISVSDHIAKMDEKPAPESKISLSEATEEIDEPVEAIIPPVDPLVQIEKEKVRTQLRQAWIERMGVLDDTPAIRQLNPSNLSCVDAAIIDYEGLGIGKSPEAILEFLLDHGMSLENQLYSVWKVFVLGDKTLFFPNPSDLLKIVMASGVDRERAQQLVDAFVRDRNHPTCSTAFSPQQFVWQQNICFAWLPIVRKLEIINPKSMRSLHIGKTPVDNLKYLCAHGMTLDNQLYSMWKLFDLVALTDVFPNDQELEDILTATGIDPIKGRQMITEFNHHGDDPPIEVAMSPRWYPWDESIVLAWIPFCQQDDFSSLRWGY